MQKQNISKIYLASKSPRRRELLRQIGIDYELLPIDIIEEVQDNENYLTYSQRICQEKSQAAWQYLQEHELAYYPVLTADTEVIFNNQVLGKPLDYADAFRIWRLLSGQQHLVITSITMKYFTYEKTLSKTSSVYFDELSDEEIHTYLATGDYKDKSGAYGIQSYAGQFIRKIDGCFYSIMGLPLNLVRQLLSEVKHYANQ
jgi:septum formation protein